MLITLTIIFTILIVLSFLLYVFIISIHSIRSATFLLYVVMAFAILTFVSVFTCVTLELFCTHTNKINCGTYEITKLDIDGDNDYYIYKDKEIYHLYYNDGTKEIPLTLEYDEEYFDTESSHGKPYIIIYQEFIEPNNDFIGFLISTSKNPSDTYYHVYVDKSQILEIGPVN